MKKLVILALALCLAMPALSFAGSAGSRWDLSIGGTLKFDVGWVDQNSNSNYTGSYRDPKAGVSDSNYDKGNTFMNATESSLVFFIRGPEGFGAKTSALLIGDFTGQWSSTTNGTFDMLIAKMSLDWANTNLSFGVIGTPLGVLPTFAGNNFGWGHLNQFDKGYPNVPGILLTQKFGKNFSAAFGVTQWAGPAGGSASATSTNSTWTRAEGPAVNSWIKYESDVCGKVGPWGLTARLGGAYARERIVDAPGGQDSYYRGYLVDFTVLVPIIPQKNDGNKKNAMYVDGIVFQTQNGGMYAPAPSGPGGSVLGVYTGRYIRPNGDYASPVINGFETHLAYYITDQLYTNFFYGYTRAHQSNYVNATAAPNGGVQNQREIIVNLMYDVNPAMRIGVEWNQYKTRYGAFNANTQRDGTMNAFRVGAYYFF